MNDALDHFKPAIKYNKKNPVHYFNKGNVHLSKNEYVKAHEEFDTALGLSDTNPKFYHAKGLAF
jgi:tetratricopeptide (TPR) repeat protein